MDRTEPTENMMNQTTAEGTYTLAGDAAAENTQTGESITNDLSGTEQGAVTVGTPAGAAEKTEAAGESTEGTGESETTENDRDVGGSDTNEKTEGTEEGQITEATDGTADSETVTEEITEIPSPQPEESGAQPISWGVVLLIVLGIVALGAAAAVFLQREKSRKGQRRTPGKKTESDPHSQAASSISCGMAQTVGKREQQQDSLYCSNWKDGKILMTRGLMAAVADGIGGLQDGDLASKNAMQAMRTAFLEGAVSEAPSDRLLACAAAAHKSVLKLNETTKCGATLVCILIVGRTMHFLSIGDSRIYLYRAGALLQLNREHVLRRENEETNQLYGTGEQLSRKRAGALTSYLGKKDLTKIDRSLQPMQLLPGDRILLMSDGVFNTLSEQEIIAHLRNKTPESAAMDMIQNVDDYDYPTQDNATVVVVGID